MNPSELLEKLKTSKEDILLRRKEKEEVFSYTGPFFPPTRYASPTEKIFRRYDGYKWEDVYYYRGILSPRM